SHPLTLLLLGDYAGLLRQMGEVTRAESVIRQTIERGRHSPLYWHPVSVDAFLELGDLVLNQKHDSKEAEKLYREALRIAERIHKQDRLAKAHQRLQALLRS